MTHLISLYTRLRDDFRDTGKIEVQTNCGLTGSRGIGERPFWTADGQIFTASLVRTDCAACAE